MREVFVHHSEPPVLVALADNAVVIPRDLFPLCVISTVLVGLEVMRHYWLEFVAGDFQLTWELGGRLSMFLFLAGGVICLRVLAFITDDDADIPKDFVRKLGPLRWLSSPRQLQKLLQRGLGTVRSNAAVLFCGGVSKEYLRSYLSRSGGNLREPAILKPGPVLTLHRLIGMYLSSFCSTAATVTYLFLPPTPITLWILRISVAVLIVLSILRGLSGLRTSSRRLVIAPRHFRVERYSWRGTRQSVVDYPLTENLIVVIHARKRDVSEQRRVTVYLITDTRVESVVAYLDLDHLLDCVSGSQGVVPGALDVATA